MEGSTNKTGHHNLSGRDVRKSLALGGILALLLPRDDTQRVIVSSYSNGDIRGWLVHVPEYFVTPFMPSGRCEGVVLRS